MTDQEAPDIQKIDEILEQEDPGFTQGLQAIKAEVIDTTVEIESLVPVEEGLDGAPTDRISWSYKLVSLLTKFRARIGQYLLEKWRRFRQVARTMPKEFALYCWVQLKIVVGRLRKILSELMALPFPQKVGVLLLIFLVVATIWLVKHNLEGSWIPGLQEEFLTNFESVADQISPVEEEEMALLREALPQPEFQVLLDRLVVNFKRRPGIVENPMGTFEIFVGVDNHDAAVEVRTRRRELVDEVSRGLEGLTYPEASGPLGVEKIKMVTKEAVSKAITQGTVQSVYLRMSITKP